jgi:hypothetical protein
LRHIEEPVVCLGPQTSYDAAWSTDGGDSGFVRDEDARVSM